MEKNNNFVENNEIMDEEKLFFLDHINKIGVNKQKINSKSIKIIILIICICILPINPKKNKINIFKDNKSNDNIVFNNKTNNSNINISNINNDKIIFNNKTKNNNINISNINNNNIIDYKINNISFFNITNLINNFDENSTKIKALSIYHSKTYPISIKDDILNNQSYVDKIKYQIEYAKNNSIYGFAIYYDWNIDSEIFNEPLDIMMKYKNLDMPFLIIFHNKNKIMENNQFIYDISRYFFDNRYIRINKKPIIGIYNPEQIPNLESNIKSLRNILKQKGLGDIFILGACKGTNFNRLIKMNIFDGFYDSTSYDSINPQKIDGSDDIYVYFYLLYKNQDLNSLYDKKDKIIFRSSDIMSQYPILMNKKNIYFDYTPDKFDFVNKNIIEWTKKKYEKNRYIFINSFDNTYLEQNMKTGRESLEKLSKLINSVPIEKPEYNFSNLQNNCLIAIQAHIFYLDLINQIISLTNNIPAKFDLYITVTNLGHKNIIEKYIKTNSKANKYEILVVENKGRDILPLLTQLKNVLHNYKYFCHIHTKKSNNNWRNYLFNNLLGKNIISEILYDFETNEKLGLIFPSTYYEKAYITTKTNKNELIYLKDIFKGISDKIKVPDFFDFPAGDMFWARSKAVHQIISLDITKSCPNEPVPSCGTILHAIERTWKFITEYNGYSYKTLFRYL